MENERNKEQMHRSHLAQGFMVAAMVNFIAGSWLGATMTMNMATAGALAPVHAVLNPFGWLTLLIYGMTFAVLDLSLGIRMPKPSRGWAQLILAEGGVLLVALGTAFGARVVVDVGSVCLVFAPILFLVNILSAVFFTRRHGGVRATSPSASHLFGRNAAYAGTDKVGQRGTDVSLMLFIVAAIWYAIHVWVNPSAVIASGALQWLLYDGWIGGTVLSVALHLAPRFYRQAIRVPRLWGVLQVWWFGATCLGLIASLAHSASWQHTATIVLAITLCCYALILLWNRIWVRTGIRRTGVTSHDGRPLIHPAFAGPGEVAWSIAWMMAFLLGVGWLLGEPPFSLWSLHMFFLGFITTLVYAVGYTAFPLIFNRLGPPRAFAYVQLLVSVLGALYLIEGFYQLEQGGSTAHWLAPGGIAAAVGFLMFVVGWLWPSRGARVD